MSAIRRACVPAPGYPHALVISAPVAARLLVREAASIDLVVVDSLSSDFALATRARDRWVSGDAEQQAAGLEWLEQVRGSVMVFI